MIAAVFLGGVVGMTGCVPKEVRPKGKVGQIKVVAVYPHDPSAFTQGLAVHGGRMYEGTGLYGESSIRRVDIETGQIERLAALDKSYFGEGVTVLDNRLFQFTWRNDIAIIYDPETFSVLETIEYNGEAWGLTNDGMHLIVSDGSASLRFLDPGTLAVERQLIVHEGAQAVDRLNELEYVRNEIWANIWYKDKIARISTVDGEIIGWINISELYPRSERRKEDVPNGIAFDAVSGRLFVTGKNWPRLYEIEVVCP